MFKPKYSISPKLLGNIKKIAVTIAELNRRHPGNIVLAELERGAREISAYSSTSIEGNPLPLTEVKKILKNAPRNARNSEMEVLNYNEVLLWLGKILDSGKADMSASLILDIHKGVLKGLIPESQRGRFRQEPVFVNNPKTGKPVYLPPDSQDVQNLMKDLVDFIKANSAKTDPLILAGIFHKQFVIIHPFTDGNGRTARLATKVLLASMGLDTFNLFSFENYYNKNVSRYFESVGVLGNYYDIKDGIDFTDWLEYFTDGIIDELMRVRKLMQGAAMGPESELKPFHRKMIGYMEQNGYINDSQYSKIVKRAKATRNIDFNKLIGLGIIQRLGKGKNTYYKLKKA